MNVKDYEEYVGRIGVISKFYAEIGVAYTRLQDYDQALKYYELSNTYFNKYKGSYYKKYIIQQNIRILESAVAFYTQKGDAKMVRDVQRLLEKEQKRGQ